MQPRTLAPLVSQDLTRKMVFLAGPRQSGKTTFSRQLARHTRARYYNYDLDADRKLLLRSELDAQARLWIFDELHKYSRWRNWLKGIYDHHHPDRQILVTGSAKLDVYSRGGDSLQGRYYFYRFHPFTLGELLGAAAPARAQDILQALTESNDPGDPDEARRWAVDLLKLGSFPEPLFSGSEREANRWRLAYSRRVVREDIRDLESIKDLALLERLYDRLPQTVGSPISLNTLREDLEVSHESVRRWLTIFDKLYLAFRVPPYGTARIKAVKKEQKLYLWDWGSIENPGARVENMVALHLLRLAHWCEDVFGEKTELRYFRNTLGQEVDFVMILKNRPWFAVEVKLKEQELDRNLRSFVEKNPMPIAFQVHFHGNKDYWAHTGASARIRVMPLWRFLAALP